MQPLTLLHSHCTHCAATAHDHCTPTIFCQAFCGVSGLFWFIVAYGAMCSFEMRDTESVYGSWAAQACALLSAGGGSLTWALQAGFNYRVRAPCCIRWFGVKRFNIWLCITCTAALSAVCTAALSAVCTAASSAACTATLAAACTAASSAAYSATLAAACTVTLAAACNSIVFNFLGGLRYLPEWHNPHGVSLLRHFRRNVVDVSNSPT